MLKKINIFINKYIKIKNNIKKQENVKKGLTFTQIKYILVSTKGLMFTQKGGMQLCKQI